MKGPAQKRRNGRAVGQVIRRPAAHKRSRRPNVFHGPRKDDYVTLHQSTHDGSAWPKQRVLSCIVEIIENSVENHYVKPKLKEQKTDSDSCYLFRIQCNSCASCKWQAWGRYNRRERSLTVKGLPFDMCFADV